MSNIFISFYNFTRDAFYYDKFPPFYESFVQGLVKEGHNVMVFHFKTDLDFKTNVPSALKKIIIENPPDLFIFFDNKFWDISEHTGSPIIVYDVDSPLFYSNPEKLLQRPDRFCFVTIQRDGVNLIEKFLKNKKARIKYIPPFTEIRDDPTIQFSKNIVFVGCNWLWDGIPELVEFISNNPSEKDLNRGKNYIKQFIHNPNSPINEGYFSSALPKILEGRDTNKQAFQFSGLNRLKTLDAIADLGLEVHGTYWNVPCMAFFPDVSFSCSKTPVSTLAENQLLYNSAKLGINTNHIQATSGFSWRVCDIMASNACLVTEKKQDIFDLFPDVPLPTFENPYEAREQCKKLLKDEILRREIVESAHKAINDRHRLSNVFKSMTDFCGFELMSNEPIKPNGTLTIFSDRNMGLCAIDSKPKMKFNPAKAYFDMLSLKHLSTLFFKKMYYSSLFPLIGEEHHENLRKFLKR